MKIRLTSGLNIFVVSVALGNLFNSQANIEKMEQFFPVNN